MQSLLMAALAQSVALSATPAPAQHTNGAVCGQWRHGECVSWNQTTRREPSAAGHELGYNFGSNYAYLPIDQLPRPVVTRYHLGANFRYVNENGRIYVVSPRTYRVVRVIIAR